MIKDIKVLIDKSLPDDGMVLRSGKNFISCDLGSLPVAYVKGYIENDNIFITQSGHLGQNDDNIYPNRY